MKHNSKLVIVGSLIAAIFLATLIISLFNKEERVTLSFSNADGSLMNVEERNIRIGSDYEENVRRYVEEALLGSENPGFLSLLPFGTAIRSLFIRDKVLYADFSLAAATTSAHFWKIFYDEILQNFGKIKDIRFFVEGYKINL
ncbi:MAG: GerMN domain-containing protein [Spirochaetaceae bacterium]|nr:GerMN domain-containing protein [Spirochaetaceae bacterium]